MPDDLTTVLEWARKHGPANIQNAACRLLGWLDDATKLVNERLYGAESHRDGRTTQTPEASEGHAATEAQETAQ